ncbi:MAG: hypothetical protein TREMPRED_004350 [Tremellales sp. Tagirdzhanova-0007]|nr:MAG: hypothetical protein TREMPRED_004350 [Tremellales sp. Tagirdzhanova-0007]
MTTSITDARYTSLHFTPGHLLSLSFDDPPETGWSVMPGFDEFIPVPAHLEPPRQDADETLPSQLHPSYPFGRPRTVGRPVLPWLGGPRNLLGGVGRGEGGGESSGSGGGMGGGMGELWGGERWGRGEGWEELGLREVMEVETRKEVPAGIAGAKRPPSPPSPVLRPSQVPQPRSTHLRNLYARQRQAVPPTSTDPFDAPLPNETYNQDEGDQGNVAQGESVIVQRGQGDELTGGETEGG